MFEILRNIESIHNLRTKVLSYDARWERNSSRGNNFACSDMTILVSLEVAAPPYQ